MDGGIFVLLQSCFVIANAFNAVIHRHSFKSFWREAHFSVVTKVFGSILDQHSLDNGRQLGIVQCKALQEKNRTSTAWTTEDSLALLSA